MVFLNLRPLFFGGCIYFFPGFFTPYTPANGKGKIARLLMNRILVNTDYGIVSIPPIWRIYCLREQQFPDETSKPAALNRDHP